MSAIAVGGLVACGDDDAGPGTTPTPDSGTSSGSTSGSTSSGGSSSGGTDSGPQKPTAAATGTVVYLGQSATLDGSGSTGANLTYAWTLTPPAGSTATLQGGNTAKPTFLPDKVGDYAATLTVTSGGQTATANATVTVTDAPVFFFSTTGTDAASPTKASLSVTGARTSDGGAGNSTKCFERDGSPEGPDAATLDQLAQYSAGIWTDWWEAPAGQASRVAFVFENKQNDGTVKHGLIGVTSTDTCVTAQKILDEADGRAISSEYRTYNIPNKVDAATPLDISVFELPRFSPNGNRLAYVRYTEAVGSRIATAGFEGGSVHVLAPLQADDTGAPDPDAGKFAPTTPGPRPVWVNDTTVAWLQVVGSGWQIVSAPDQDNAASTVLMTCSGVVPSQFDVLPSGEILVSQAHTEADAAANAVDLIGYTPTAGTKVCGAPRNVTKLISNAGGSRAEDFSLSPDKKLVAFKVTTDGPNAKVTIRVTPVDGSSPGVDVAPGHSVFQGPRWVAGGTTISWGVDTDGFDAGTGQAYVNDGIAVATADGGTLRLAAGSTSTDDHTRAIGNNTGNHCSLGYGVGSAVSGFGFLGLLGLGITRRRNKKQS